VCFKSCIQDLDYRSNYQANDPDAAKDEAMKIYQEFCAMDGDKQVGCGSTFETSSPPTTTSHMIVDHLCLPRLLIFSQ
jgi:hypothetical protein